MTSLEQRRHKRFEVRDVKGSLLFRTQVQLRNVSVSGLSFETTERLKLGRNYSLRLTNAEGGVDLTGTIRWCHLARTKAVGQSQTLPVYEVGFAFDDVFTDRGQGLIHFIEQHVVLPLEKRITGRFTLETAESADIETRYDFEVLKLSMSGMLVRTQLETAVDSRFGMEVGLKSEMLSVNGRVASVSRSGGTIAEPLSELGIEFVEMHGDVNQALTHFIAEELQ